MTEILHGSLGAAVGPVGSEVGHSPSTLSPGQSVPAGGLAPGQRWSVGRKREVVLRLLRGEAAESLSRELGVPVYRLERWRERALLGIDGALREREGDAVSEELAAAMRRVGELTMENEVLRARVGHAGPFAPRGARGWAPRSPRGPAGFMALPACARALALPGRLSTPGGGSSRVLAERGQRYCAEAPSRRSRTR